MLIGIDILKMSVCKPLADFFYEVIVAFWGCEDIKSVIELHIEREMTIVGEGKCFLEFWETNTREPAAKKIDPMNYPSGEIAKLVEEGFGELLQERAQWFIEVEHSRVITAIIDPNKHLSARFKNLG